MDEKRLITGTDYPWLYSSGVRDPGAIAIQTAPTADAAESAWTMRLHFAEFEAAPAGKRVFNIKLQGETVLRDFDIARTAGVDPSRLLPIRVLDSKPGRG